MKTPFRKNVRYLITRGIATPDNFQQQKSEILDVVRGAVASEIDLIQIREKKLSANFLFEIASEAVAIAEGTLTKILINDRFDIALAARAQGVHLTSRSIPAGVVRSHVPKEFIIGVSRHTLDETISARDGGADFALFGPIFETPGKGEAVGLEKLSAICEAVDPFPVIGVGGIDEANFEQVMANGAAGFASIRYLNDFVKMRQ